MGNIKSDLKNQNFILLSIHEIHAERIFAGEKLYELRKILPKEGFERVFLYQSGGKGLVGTFEVEAILSSSPKKLWTTVKDKATSRERFFSYFAQRELGYAIEVKNPLKFHSSVGKDELSKLFKKFSVPQNFIYVRPGTTLHSFLVDETLKALKKKSVSPVSNGRSLTNLEI